MILPWEQSWNHPSVLTILDKYKSNSIFTFSHVAKKEVLKEMGNLHTTELCQDTDFPTKLIKQNSDIFASFICKTCNNIVDTSIFLEALKLAHITPAYRKGSCQIFQTSMKDTWLNKCLITSGTFSLNSSVGFAKVSVSSTVF